MKDLIAAVDTLIDEENINDLHDLVITMFDCRGTSREYAEMTPEEQFKEINGKRALCDLLKKIDAYRAGK